MRILFICTGNSFRSPTAEALAKKYRPEFEIESAGISPAGKIASNAVRLLKFENCKDFIKNSPEPVTGDALKEADRVIVMEDEHVDHLLENYDVSPEKIDNWNVKDPINPNVEPKDSFEEIKNKVKKL